jgi:hypothetical protein
MRKEHGDAGAPRWKPLFGCIVSHPRELDAATGKRQPLPFLILRPRHSEFSSVLDSVLPSSNGSAKPDTRLPSDPLDEFEPSSET